jgi:hypothetical protein
MRAGNNNDKNDRGDGRLEIEKAQEVLREETLPSLAAAYDKAGPAAVLALTFMLADVWLESGFTPGEWRSIIAIFDAPESAS